MTPLPDSSNSIFVTKQSNFIAAAASFVPYTTESVSGPIPSR